MMVLDMHTYDAILGFDWLQKHSPMQCDCEKKTLQFTENGKTIKLEGLTNQPLELTSISASKVYISARGNDVWAFVLLYYIPEPSLATLKHNPQPHPDIQHLLDNYSVVFSYPQSAPVL